MKPLATRPATTTEVVRALYLKKALVVRADNGKVELVRIWSDRTTDVIREGMLDAEGKAALAYLVQRLGE